MSRDGFTRFDGDVGFYSDPKVVALARRLRDPVKTAAYAALYDATLRASWKAGRRLTLEEALPAWWLDASDAALADLVAVRLLDADGRVLDHAWASWFKPAAERVAEKRVDSMVGGLMTSLGMTKEEAVAEARRRVALSSGLGGPQVDLGGPSDGPSPPDLPDLPAQPTEPTEPTEPTDSGGAPPAPAHASKPRNVDKSTTNGDPDTERRRLDALRWVASHEVDGVQAKNLIVDYALTDDEIASWVATEALNETGR